MAGSGIAQIGVEHGRDDPRQRNALRGKRYFSVRISQEAILLQLDQLGKLFDIPVVCKSQGSAGRALGFADDWYVEELPELIQLEKDRLLTYADGKVSLTPEGVPLARVVAAVFDTYLRDYTARQ